MIGRKLQAVLIAMFVFTLGCESEIVPATAHDPIAPAQVKIYQKAPQKYEVLGTVEVPVGGEVRWDNRGDADAGFKKLQELAAAKGANGVLLKTAPNIPSVTAGYNGVYYQVPIRLSDGKPTAAWAEAIFVHKE